MKTTTSFKKLLIVITLGVGLLGVPAYALVDRTIANPQTTAFTYQGKLADNGNPANGPYDFQFKLFDTPTVGTGTQLGTVTVPTMQVTAGIFTVQLDFGVSVFPGAARFIEIAVKKTIDSTLTTLSPRQPITSNPYAIRSLAATAADGLSVTCVGCITSNQIQNVQGSQVTGLLPVASVPPGSSNYVQNSTSQQETANFNVSGDGTAAGTLSGNVLNATVQYNLGGSRVLSQPGTSNLFAGTDAGQSNTTGSRNAFFGRSAGRSNTTGLNNSFFGSSAGINHTTGLNNSFFGQSAGAGNTAGNSNSFFGDNAGSNNTTGNLNSFFGRDAGFFNTTGGNNVFVGLGTGSGNTTGSNITIVGTGANVGADNLSFATVIGAGAIVSTSNTVVLGRAGDTVQIPGALSVSGAFGADILNAVTQFNLGGNRVLSNAGSSNLFAGVGSGQSNSGIFNSFFGANAGQNNTIGNGNSFFGQKAGQNNTTGTGNSFFGSAAGLSTTTGGENAFFGAGAGQNNTTGADNSFVGLNAGQSNTTGIGNVFSGTGAGISNLTGNANAFFGTTAGRVNTTGSNNTFIGNGADFSAINPTGDNNTLLGANTKVDSSLSNATAIGNRAQVSQSNSLILGGISGVNGGTNTNVGIGTTAPRGRLEIVGNWDGSFGAATLTGDRPTIRFSGGSPPANQQWILHLGSAVGLTPAGSLSFFNGGTTGTFSLPAMALTPSGTVAITNLGSSGTNALCRNASNEISSCSSSLRYKTGVQPLAAGLQIINRLRPVSFTWKQGGKKDIGLAAEDVEKVEPLLTFRNDKGEIEGVKYSQLSAVFVNAFKQQQSQIKHHHQQIAHQQQEIKQQQSHLEKQQRQIEALKKLVCSDHPSAELCK